MWEVGIAAELAGIAICDECEGAEIVIFLPSCERFHTEHLRRLIGAEERGDCRLDDGDIRCCASSGTEFLDEAAVMERAPFWSGGRAGGRTCVRGGENGGVGYLNRFVVVGYIVALAGNRVYVVKAV
jgi:hypothetical protein